MKMTSPLFTFFLGIVVGGIIFSTITVVRAVGLGSEQIVVHTPTPTPTPIINPPQRLIIGKLGIDTEIEHVGIDTNGKVDVPKNPQNVGWYMPGYKPGENGSAVIDGHLDTETSAPAIFYSLNLLELGDKVDTIDIVGKKRTFEVVKTQSYPYDEFPSEAVFAPGNTPLLNLITCQGIWDVATRNYSKRLIVYTRLLL